MSYLTSENLDQATGLKFSINYKIYQLVTILISY